MHGQPLPVGEIRIHQCLVCDDSTVDSNIPGLVRCKNCGFMSANMTLTEEEQRALYGRNYFEGTTEWQDYSKDADTLKLNFRRRIEDLKSIIPRFEDRSLFEIGCAYGYFLEVAAPYVRKISGIEVSDDVAQIARERGNAIGGDYTTTEIEPADTIVMWDVIEHLARPDLFVAKAARDVTPGGFLAITTGDIGSLNARMRGRYWRMIHPPTHLHFFSVETLSRLVERHGFEVVHVSHPGSARQFRSVAHILLVLKYKMPKVFDFVSRLPGMNRSFTLNLWDIMFVVARKR
jgi:2-polyprenyl-3-methyl-5-hydroxy-6-metoxy-1,4-benzoquinol methylase